MSFFLSVFLSLFSLLYKPIGVYHVAIVVDFTIRCLWVATLQSSWCHSGCSMIFSFLEIGRRFMWVVFRIEFQAIKASRAELAGEALRTRKIAAEVH